MNFLFKIKLKYFCFQLTLMPETEEWFAKRVMAFSQATGITRAKEGSPEYEKEIAVIKEGTKQKPDY